MSKRLILMRHAKSPQSITGRDHARPLNQTGRKQAEEIGTLLSKKEFVPDIILTSRSRRTLQTAELLVEAAGLDEQIITPTEGLYNSNADQIVRVIRTTEIIKDANTIMILAHNPGISRLAMECCGPMTTLYFSPGSIATFELEEEIDWQDFETKLTKFLFYKEPKN